MCGELIKISGTARKQRNYSIIHWETGEPKEEGEYLVTLLDGRIAVDRWLMPWPCNTEEDDISVWEMYDEEVVAWCKLSDINPYKEENE